MSVLCKLINRNLCKQNISLAKQCTCIIYLLKRAVNHVALMNKDRRLILYPYTTGREYRCENRYLTIQMLDISLHVLASQLCVHCDDISNRVWCHQQNVNPVIETRGRCVTIVVSITIHGIVMSCKTWNNVCTVVTDCLCPLPSIILLFVPHVASQLGE